MVIATGMKPSHVARGAKASKAEALEIRAQGTLAAFKTLSSLEELENGNVLSKARKKCLSKLRSNRVLRSSFLSS